MSLKHAKQRDRKYKNKKRMKVDGKSVFLIAEIQRKRAEKIRQKREEENGKEN